MKNQLTDFGNSFDGDLRGKLIELVKQSASEEKFIQFISSTLESGSKLTNFKAHEIILDLTLAVVDQFGHVDFNYLNQHDSSRLRSSNLLDESPIFEESNERRVPDLSSYDGDDEEFDDTFIFPCHVVYDDCHPEPLSDYYREHLKPARSPIQIVKLPKVCEFVIKSAFGQLQDYLEASTTNLDERNPSRRNSVRSYEQPSSKTSDSASSSSIGSLEESEKQTSGELNSSSNCDQPNEQQAPAASLPSQLSGIVRLIKKLNKVCLSERRNCRILAKTGILGVVLENIDFLIEQRPDEQHIYLEPLVKFVFTLSDYKISGQNLKQLFKIIKNEETNLNVVLKNLQNLLNHQYRILRNIQPSKSINFPTASRTPEEIEYDRYLANSWHWRLRSKVIENKRRRSRTDSQTQDLKLLSAASQFRLSPPSTVENNSTGRDVAAEDSDRVGRLADGGTDSLTESSAAATRTNSSWLECSLMTPLSNISPLIHNNEVKFCCSLWLSVCGDLLVVESNKLPSAKRRRAAATNRALEAGLESAFHIDWSALNGHWLRLTSRRRLFRRHRNKQLAFGLQPRQRRLSAKIRTRQAYDQEDEERDEKEEKARKSDVEVSQGHSRSGRRFKLFHSSLRRHPENSINRSLDKQKHHHLQQQQQQNHHRVRISTKRLQPPISGGESTTMINGAGSSQYEDEGKTVQRMRQHSHEQLIHLVSFAMDSLTIEIWLNVKCMTFYVRTCRVTREGQTDVHDSVTFPSHLEANGSWSNVIICLEEESEKQKMKAVNLKLIVNGIHEEQVRLVFSAHRSALTNFALLIGCERSTFGYVWKLSQINLYKNIPDKNMPIYLLGKGPDFWSFTNFRQQSLLPLPDITQRHRRIVYDPKLLLRYSSIDEEQTLNWLTQNIVISYVAHQPEHFLDYSPSMAAAYSIMNPLPADYEFSNSAERFIQAKTLDFSRSIRFNQNNSIGSALVEAGGVESVLVSFAEVVRRSNESSSAHQTHALAFSVLLKMVQTNLYHLSKFLDELNGLKLIEYILAHPKCQVSCEMLESYLDFCLISPSSHHHHNHHHQRPLIKSPKVIYHLMISWRVWHKEAKVAKLLYRRLIRLLHTTAPQIQRGKHDSDYYHIEHNFRMISQAGGIDILMDVLRECLLASDDDSPDYIDHELIGLIVQLISLLFKQPPGLDVMLDITEFLLFLHPDPKAYVEVSQDRLAFLNQIEQYAIDSTQDYDGERMVFDDEIQNSSGGARTPFSLTPSESEESSPESEHRPHGRRLGSNNLIRGLSNSRHTNSINSSTTDLRNRISRQCSRNLAELVGQYNRGTASGTAGGKLKRLRRSPSQTPSESGQSATNCSNRNYAIARIADMLHFSIIEPTSVSNTLTEALFKSIIDPRKFIILANNELAQVREKVLRLFLYCIRACYTSPDLKSLLMKYEQATESANYKICTPIHLMGRQLLKYSTTSKMIQFCHGILVGVSDFEAADTFFASFEIDTNIDQFQLNILVLLIQLVTKLPQPREIIAGLRIVLVCMRQLVRLREISTVLVLIKNDLRDCLMSLYFSHVRSVISWAMTRQMAPNGTGDHDEDKLDDDDGEHDDGSGQCETLVMELDKMLVFIVRFYLQNQPTSEMVKSINELILYLESLNTQVPVQFKCLLRDRMVKLFLTKLRFCAHYETCAKQQASSRRLFPTIVGAFKSLLPNSDSNKFSNVLPEFEPSDLDDDLSENLWPLPACGIDLNNDVKSSGNGTSVETSDQQEFEGDEVLGSGSNSTIEMEPEEELSERIEISESSVIERFDCTFSMIVNFVTTREPDVIPSPLERRFIIMCLKRLARYLLEHDSYKSPSSNAQVRRESNASAAAAAAKQVAQAAKRWTRILTKLEHSLRTHFTSLILYLLSPTNNGMNLDERKYFAHQILDMFQVDQLLAVLGESPLESEHKILLAFIKDLMDYDETNGAQQEEQTIYEANGSNQSEEDDEEEEEELLDDTEIKLRELICGLESELSSSSAAAAAQAGSKLRLSYKSWFRASLNQDKSYHETTNGGHQDQKRQAIWLDNLAKAREDLRFQVDTFRVKLSAGCGASNQKQTLAGVGGGGGGSLESLTLSSRSMDERGDRFLDEAVKITRDVVNDKHEQRKAYLEDVKQNKIYNYHMRQQWLSLIIGHTHERAIWFLEDYYPKSWELNPVEGPSRTRRRLRPYKLKLESRFLRRPVAGGNTGEHCVESSSESTPDSNDDDDGDDNSADWYSLYSPHPLCSLIINNEQSLDSNELRIRMFTTDKIHFNCDCSIIRPNEVCHGEVSIASWCIHFIGNRGDEMDLRPGGSLNICGRTTKQQRLGSVKSSGGSRINSQRPLDRSQSTYTRNTLTSRVGNQSATSHTTNGTTRPLVTSTVVEDLWFDEIVEIWDRRYQLQEVGLEIFLTNNMTYLLSFRTSSDREDFKQNLMREQHKMINLQRFNLTSSLTRLTQLWRDGKLTNFDYLTCLNKLAGRSFNDLMQYPVFPFVLSNYTSSVLDLNEPENFRNLKRPMAIQNEAREENFKNVYQMSLSSGPTISSFGLSKPYHYGNHYSNSATVLHFLVRLPPFTQMLIEYQDNNFDQPDRTFHAVANTWQLITRDSNTDFKELIPEFFFLPEMFINLGNLELGRKQNNELVDDVKLPAWCPNGDARLFTLIHRQALESAFVSENLHHWIDLIFGYKQTGKPAIEALNVFHPATYYGGVDLSQRTGAAAAAPATGGSGAGSSSSSATAATDSLSAINLAIAKSSSVNFSALSSTSELRNSNSNLNSETTNHLVPFDGRNQQAQHSPRRLAINKFLQADIERSALETMIKTYGQMPRQLFSAPMKQRSANLFAQQLNENQLEKHQRQRTGGLGTINQEAKMFLSRKLEPLKQVRGLRWGSYVGSPSDSDVIAVKHKRIILEPVKSDYRIKRNAVAAGANFTLGPKLLSKQSDKFHFCLLPNGDVAILRNNTSLMLDYRADRKSSGTTYQLSIPSARYSRRAGLSRVSRMNLFSNMIISRQQFSFLEPIHAPITTSQFGVDSSSGGGTSGQGASSLVASITGSGSGSGGSGSSASSRAKFSLDSLNLVSWFYIDGVVRVKHPAPSHQQPSIPLVQANTIVDTMTTCLSVPELNLLLIGYRSGSICAHIVSTAYEMVPLKQKRNSVVVNNEQQKQQQQQLSAGPSAIHFLNTTSSVNSNTLDVSLLGPGRVSTDKALNGELYTAVSLAGKTLQSVRSMNKTTRWLYCHEKRVNCIKINVSFGIVVTGSDDGTSVIWDLNSLTFVRTIDYRLSSLNVRKKQNNNLDDDKENGDQNGKSNHEQDAAHKSSPSPSKPRNEHYVYWTYGKAQEQKLQDYLCTCNQISAEIRHDDDLFHSEQFRRQRYLKHQSQPGRCFICSSGVNLIAISDTLGDIVTIKQLSNRLAASAGNEPPTSGNQTRNNSRERDQIPFDQSQRSQFMTTTTTTTTVGGSAELSRTQSTCSSEDSSLTSVIYLHSINGALINFVNCHAQVTAVSYSNAPEGISINVIVVGMVDGLIRLYSSWDLSRVKEFRVSGLESPISDIMYTRDSQLMYIAYEDGQMVVLRNKKKGSVSLPKEWIL